jgi:hypothetical protein
MVYLLDRLSDGKLVLAFIGTLAFTVWVNLNPFGYTWIIPNLFLEVLGVGLLYLEYREMRGRGWFD